MPVFLGRRVKIEGAIGVIVGCRFPNARGGRRGDAGENRAARYPGCLLASGSTATTGSPDVGHAIDIVGAVLNEERTITGRNGETRTQTGDFAVAKTADGRTVTGDINTPNAGQIDYSKTVARTENGRSVNAVSTFEDGTTRTRASSTACADGTCATEGALTRRNGNELTRAATRTKTDDGSVKSATTTFADGTTRNLDRDVSHEDGQVVIDRNVTGRGGETRKQTGNFVVTPK